MFDLKIVSPKKVILEEAVEKVRIDGDESEYEFLSFHANCIGVLREGLVVINDRKAVPVKKGIVAFKDNKCTILVEESA